MIIPNIELIKQEADNLKKFATQDEIDNLDFDDLYPTHNNNCIYGQMTGDCHNERAIELLKLCTIPFSDTVTTYQKPTRTFEFIETIGRAFSPIEYFIAMDYHGCMYGESIEKKEYNNELLIDYIKGNSNTLDFKL